jgi:hypothetical protein
MKIIIRNVPFYQCSCTNCTSVFQFEKKESKWEYGGYSEKSSIQVTCPVCNERLYLDMDDVKKVIVHEED